MSDIERDSGLNNQRSRSRSPVRRRTSDDRGRGYRDRGNNNYPSRQRNDYNRGSRYDTGRYDTGRYDNRNRDYGAPSRGRPGPRDRRTTRTFNNKGDYGPRLARELDSSYEEKVNRNYSNSIFVGNLTYDCTPDDLRDFFSQIGEVVRADIITSRGHHRGMGTVEFTNNDDVTEAIRQYDGSDFMERQIFVRQDNPPPESRRERVPPSNDHRDRYAASNDRHSRPYDRASSRNTPSDGNYDGFEIFVANLPFSVNWQALKDMFKPCGNVLRADVELDHVGRSRGFGTVLFSNQEDMRRAIDDYNGYEIEGRRLDVREGYRNSRNGNRNGADETNKDSNETEAQAQSNSTVDFTEGYISGDERNNFIYCSNLPFSTDRSDLYDLFETIGKVINAELRYDSANQPTGVAVIEYENIEDADVCIERLNNYNYGGCDLVISYAKKE
ncbi:hypothetical protein KAFR_0H03110 [Kazachstania africana CBS 2517]|uniref:RRM domain-containing protein n=1 Tax=Kazachstania africana (strain ATCC 22294 / BCRC 22015 / CBS 2517 / CECT 1963 / NBRC 1671 / NRRL Y-8276) TaxID=1071382 RepID=H2AZG5_KAZAF|nr:hypothetical protein KAFR_0H03110 [Kazachstania africana CBS 2517]CCF59721.1 hypothetical protein KAFR_0H03110 [Kazachstania africana CBS 2517]